MASASTTTSIRSASSTPRSPPIPSRSILRPKTSASTITRDHRPPEIFTSPVTTPSNPPMTAVLADRPNTSPSPRQSYFDKYPRAAKSKEKLAGPSGLANAQANVVPSADRTASARAKIARERLKVLSGKRDSDSEEAAAAPSSSQKAATYAFPSVDDSDENAASTSSSSPAHSPRRPRQQSNASSSKARVRTPHSHKKSPSTDVALSGGASRLPRELPRSHGHTQLAAISRAHFATSDLPFIRTSTSSSYTQTTLADQDHEFTPVSTPKSSLYRSDGVLVAVPSSGLGVETMDALVHQMNGGADTTEESDYMANMFGKRTPKEKRHPATTNGFLGGGFMKHHPLYHPPLPSPPDGVALGTPKPKSGRKEAETTEEERSSSNTTSAAVSVVSSSEREREKENERKPPRKPSSNGLSSTATGHDRRPGSGRSDVTVKQSGRTPIGTTDERPRKSSTHSSSRDRDRDRDRPRRHRDKDRTRSREQIRSPSVTPPAENPDPMSSARVVDLAETPRNINDAIRKNQSPAEVRSPTIVPSISEIIRTHAPAHARPKRPAGPFPPSSYTGVASSTGHGESSAASITSRTRIIEEVEEEEITGRSSMDSIAAEVQVSLRKTSSRFTPRHGGVLGRDSSEDLEDRIVTVSSPVQKRPPRSKPRGLHHAKSFGDRPQQSGTVPDSPGAKFAPTGGFIASRSPRSESGSQPVTGGNGRGTPSMYSGPAPSLAPSSALSFGSPVLGFSMGNAGLQPHDQTKHELAQFLRSPRLTRLLTLRRHPHAGLTVSMADVGSPTGHPVIVYLGLGCVRYLIALYDEMAEALNLRLVCVDRWGLGRTGEPKNPEGRGLLEWAGVIEEVADTLHLETYSVVAHSAGAPYALAGVLKCGDRRVKGSVHLLAPWVSMSVDTGYKWLKYVPNGIIKTAQAAEWKVQGWRLGKPPTITYQAIGYDATAYISSLTPHEQPTGNKASPLPPTAIPNDLRSSISTSDYDDLADFDGRYGSNSTLGQMNQHTAGSVYQDAGKGKKKPVKSLLSIFNGKDTNGSTSPTNAAGSKGSSVRSSRASSLTGSSVKTLPAGKSPTLKGLKSLSSLRSGSSYPDDVVRRTSEPPTPNPVRPSDIPELPARVGLGLGMDDEMMEWGARLQMLEEISPPTPPSSVAGAGGYRVHSSTVPRPSNASRASTEGQRRRSVSLTGGNPSIADLPPVPPLPFTAAGTEPKSPNTSMNSNTSTAAPRKGPMSLTNALLRASHAESLKGGTADLLAILERDSKPWGFSYADIRKPVKVWYGDRDEKIAVSSVRWMERVMKDCTLNIVKGGNHNLMTNAEVVVEVLESVARDWGEETPINPAGPSPSSSSMMSPPSSSSLYRRRGRAGSKA